MLSNTGQPNSIEETAGGRAETHHAPKAEKDGPRSFAEFPVSGWKCLGPPVPEPPGTGPCVLTATKAYPPALRMVINPFGILGHERIPLRDP